MTSPPAPPSAEPSTRGVDPRVERTRGRVLRATADLLLEDGFERLTIDEVAARSGVARSTVYRNWPTRAPLLVDAVQTLLDPAVQPDSGDPREDVVAILLTLARALDPTTPQGRLLPGLLAAADRDPDLGRLHRRAAAERRDLLAAVLERGQQSGVLPVGVDAGALASRLTALLYYRRLVSGEPLDEESVRGLVSEALGPAVA